MKTLTQQQHSAATTTAIKSNIKQYIQHRSTNEICTFTGVSLSHTNTQQQWLLALNFVLASKSLQAAIFTCIFMSFRMPFPFHAFPTPLDSLDARISPNFSCSEVLDLFRFDLSISVRSPTRADFAVTWLNSLRDRRCSREHHHPCFICSEL